MPIRAERRKPPEFAHFACEAEVVNTFGPKRPEHGSESRATQKKTQRLAKKPSAGSRGGLKEAESFV